jgi:transcriptional regulator with XRE-family HTH domain
MTAAVSSVLLPLVAANLRRERERADLSQEQLETRAALSKGYVSKLEAGKCAPTLQMLERLAQAMGADPVVLFRRNGK